MKLLQNNFTTPEQSRRLLELGVPADSADLFYHSLNKMIQRLGMFGLCIVYNTTISSLKETADEEGLIVIPCWSVGRLMEIYEIVGENAGQCVSTTKSTSRIESLVQLYEENATLLDFSKLEE